MTLTATDRRIAHIRRIIAREFGILYTSTGPGPASTGVTRRQLMRAEAKIRAALTEREDKQKS
jgi:hypothetical protein